MSDTQVSNIPTYSFIKILIAIIISWVLINIWTIFIKAFCFNLLGLNKNNWIHTGLISLIFTFIFVLYIRNSGKERCTIENKMIGVLLPPVSEANMVTD